MAISTANLKWYRCVNWTTDITHGGGISANEISKDNIANSIFPDVANDLREAGGDVYRKIFFKNENSGDGSTYSFPRFWISQDTLSPDDQISLMLAGSKSQVGTDVELGGNATFTQGSLVIRTDADMSGKVVPGEMVFPLGARDNAVTVKRVYQDAGSYYIEIDNTLHSGGYGGLTATNTIYVKAINATGNFKRPVQKSTAIVGASLAAAAAQGIWVKLTVFAKASGYDQNTFAITVENSSTA